MKQIRMMALMGMTLIMGMVMTACLSSNEEDNKTTQNVIALYEGGTLQDASGIILVPTSSTYVPTADGIYSITIEFDPTSVSNNKLNVTIKNPPYNITNDHKSRGEGVGNINLYAVEYNNGYNYLKPEMFNQDYILIPCIFWMDDVSSENYTTEYAKHHFTLLYPNDLTNAEGVLNLTLIDMVADPTVSRYKNSYEYQAFDLRHIISEFKAVNGKLSTIRISGMVNKNSCDPEDGSTTTESVDVPYNPLR